MTSTPSSGKPGMRPVVWDPPPHPARSAERVSRIPLPVVSLLPLGGEGPEHVTPDGPGRLLTGVADGRVLRVHTGDGSGPRVEEVTRIAGRPLGLEPLPDGRLLVCDADHGLLRVDPATGAAENLWHGTDAVPSALCSNVVTAADGTVYVSSSSGRYRLRHYKGDLLEHSGTGCVVRLAPGEPPEVVLEGLHFANGLTLAADGSYLVVAETGAYRLTRLWLTGPRAGQRDTLADGLPGFPDNLSAGAGGLVWAAIAGPRDELVDRLHRRPAALRRSMWRLLPYRALPNPPATAWVMAFDADGRVVHDLQRPLAGFRMATSVCEHEGRLYLGSLVGEALACVDLPAGPTGPAAPQVGGGRSAEA